jgi:O-antigen ligase
LLAIISWNISNQQQHLWIVITLASLGIAGLSMAGSRGPFLSLGVAIFCLLLVNTNKDGFTSSKFLPITILTLAFLAFWNPLPMKHLITQSYCQKLLSEEYNEEESCTDFDAEIQERISLIDKEKVDRTEFSDAASVNRLALWQASSQAVFESPIFGKSNWEVNKGQYPHNLTLEAFQNLGLVGGVGFIGLLLVGCYRAWQCLRSGKLLLPMLFVQALVASQFSGSLYAFASLWVTLALLLTAKADQKEL